MFIGNIDIYILNNVIAEIGLKGINLYYVPWPVVVVDLYSYIMTQLFFVLSYLSLDISLLRKSLQNQ